MDFAALTTRTKLWLNFNDGQADQDFSDAQIAAALNMAYSEEVTKAKQEGSRRWFRASTETTWTSGDVTFTVPPPLNRVAVMRIMDVTDDVEPGTQLLFSEEGFTGDIFWKDRNTLQWGSDGPSSDRTLRFYYVASPEELIADSDIPELIPDEFHELLPLSAAIYLRLMGDEQAPTAWAMKQQELRFDYWKFITRGRPLDDIPWIDVSESDLDVGILG